MTILFFVSSLNTFATEIENNQLNNNFFEKTNYEGNKYDGFLRIYVVEKESRWRNYNGLPYHNALLEFAFNDEISIRYLETYEDTINWQGDVKSGNVMVMFISYSFHKLY